MRNKGSIGRLSVNKNMKVTLRSWGLTGKVPPFLVTGFLTWQSSYVQSFHTMNASLMNDTFGYLVISKQNFSLNKAFPRKMMEIWSVYLSAFQWFTRPIYIFNWKKLSFLPGPGFIYLLSGPSGSCSFIKIIFISNSKKQTRYLFHAVVDNKITAQCTRYISTLYLHGYLPPHEI